MTCTLLCGCCGSDCGTADASLDYAAINAQAAEQYLRPIRPGYEGRNPFWNGFAKKFIYAPAFDFDEVAGAANYRFTVVPLGEETQASWSFTADSPKAALTPVWGEIPVGRVRLTVEGLDASGKVLGKAGEREFLRDYPFTGPYTPAVRDYRQAALMGLLYIHRMPEIQYWAEHTEPDMNYRHNTYPCKIIGATIRAEALLARLLPAHKEQATRIARNAAQFLIDQSRPAGDPLAFFPPTYYKDLIASKRTENQNKTMTMEAASAGHAFLDLYDLTGDKTYYDRALGIADTYVRLQREDGSLPIKVDFVTGEPVNDACAMLHPLLRYFQRLKADYGVETYAEAQAEGERWMRDVAIRNFDMTGQFEDVTVLGLQPYENLTNCTAAPYAAYLLSKEAPSAEDLADAVDLARFSEDQFTFWDTPLTENGIKDKATPCVYEQYKYQKPVDNSLQRRGRDAQPLRGYRRGNLPGQGQSAHRQHHRRAERGQRADSHHMGLPPHEERPQPHVLDQLLLLLHLLAAATGKAPRRETKITFRHRMAESVRHTHLSFDRSPLPHTTRRRRSGGPAGK